LIEPPVTKGLSTPGRDLIYEFEVGGQSQYERNPHPELPDLRYSGVTFGIGWDRTAYSKNVALSDWSVLPGNGAQRVADTPPLHGAEAVPAWRKVRDLLVPWSAAEHVFLANDVAREFASARRAYGPAFDGLTQNCQAALIANGFARGYSTIGANRTELRVITGLVPKKDYHGIAEQLRAQARVWEGTSIERGLKARVYAEAKLAETPDAL
jgi:GH24 family phage-related lysozyme (muramidase)